MSKVQFIRLAPMANSLVVKTPIDGTAALFTSGNIPTGALGVRLTVDAAPDDPLWLTFDGTNASALNGHKYPDGTYEIVATRDEMLTWKAQSVAATVVATFFQ